jgi:hypothetical protein
MKKFSVIAVVAAGWCFSLSAASIISVNAINSDTHALNGGVGTFKTGDALAVARGSTIYNPNPYTVPMLGSSTAQAPVYAYSDRNHAWVGFGAVAGGAPDAANFPSYLLGLDYVITMNDNRNNVSPALQIDITTSGPGTAYLFLDNRTGDGAADSAPTLANSGSNLTQWVLDDGWTLVNTGLKPSYYPGNNDILGIDEGNDGAINQYASIYSRQIAGNFFSVKTQGESVDMYGVAFAPIPEPGVFILGGFGLLLAGLHRRQ